MALKRRGDGSRVRAGDMTRELIIKQQVLTDDGQGGSTGVLTEMARAWANVIPLPASKAISYGMVLIDKPHEVDMWWEEDAYTLDENTILEDVESGQILYVQSVINADMEHYRAKLVCKEKK